MEISDFYASWRRCTRTSYLPHIQTTKHFGLVFIIGTCSLSKAFAKDPLESDIDEVDNSQSETESDEADANKSDLEPADDTKEDNKPGIVDSPALL